MIEYDQAVVRLGLEKANVQVELDRLRVEATEIGERKAMLLNEIADTEKKLLVIRQEIMDAVNAGKGNIAELSRAQQEAGQATTEKTKKLVQLEEYIISSQEKVRAQEELFVSIGEKVGEAKRILDGVRSEQDVVLKEKRSVEMDIVALQEVRNELKELVAASEEKMAYLAEKEQFLNRKEADLIKYEKRVEKMREDTGNKNKMTFK